MRLSESWSEGVLKATLAQTEALNHADARSVFGTELPAKHIFKTLIKVGFGFRLVSSRSVEGSKGCGGIKASKFFLVLIHQGIRARRMWVACFRKRSAGVCAQVSNILVKRRHMNLLERFVCLALGGGLIPSPGALFKLAEIKNRAARFCQISLRSFPKRLPQGGATRCRKLQIRPFCFIGFHHVSQNWSAA